MDVIKRQFGEKLKTIRNIRGLTQEVLAEKIGINWRQLARIEAGDSFIKSDTLYKLCTVLEISPAILFDFNIQNEHIMTGTDNKIYFNVIKKENIIKLIPQKEIKTSVSSQKTEEELSSSFDSKMLSIAQKLQKDVIVNEYHNETITAIKIYTQNGEIKTKEISQNEENLYKKLKNNLTKISTDKNKLEYINLAFDSLNNKKSLEQLQFLIKGLELTLS